ncbi:ATP-dependent helicase [Flavobacterium sp. RSP49]|uniref:UvrD-helicase domain-containing protein n=1 Tax=Flavobacterium sp. RSP49 TaxID=2497487 RepID=UPI000F829113|nr:UvrD-helicase domain-containing protein [Flavobacterium sp. RSP49]RTY97107.1 ATP-dependent helicase [Flavobacterium sp. RSP49]
MKIEIEDIHILEAEQIFINGSKFDKEERIPFIKNLETCDLLAVPGSGKTTALMAKLYCLSKQLPFDDGSGILVLAHTNVAVDEIEKKLKKHCPNLFEYPNFVGTIQSFVNKFLANQACFEKYGSYIKRNEDDFIYKDILKKVKSKKGSAYWVVYNAAKSKYNKLDKDFILKYDYQINEEEAEKIILNLQNAKFLNTKLALNYDYKKIKDSNLSEFEKKIAIEFNKILDLNAKENSALFDVIKSFKYNEKNSYFTSERLNYNLQTSTNSGKELKEIFEESYNSGNLIFNDSFRLGNEYLCNYPQIKTILQKRFKYVFIDEMQDLEKFQIDIIDEIFFESDSSTIIQRIGDKNQSIYNNVREICDWITRQAKEPKKYKDLSLQNSLRLNKTIGKLVDCFVLERSGGYTVRGLFNFKNEIGISNEKLNAENEIPPHLILFTNETKHMLKDKFEYLIKDFKLDCLEIIKDKKSEKANFKIVAWNTVWDSEKKEDGKIRLIDVFPEYSKEAKAKKEYFTTLSKYLQLFDQEKKTLESARKSILNALTTVLYYQKIRFSISQLMDSIKTYRNDDGEEFYENFKQKLYLWSFDIAILKDYEVVFNSVKNFIETDFKYWFLIELTSESKEFISTFTIEIILEKEDIDETKLNFDIASVHSVKGQTLIATMYIETAYDKPVYETLKLKEASKNKSKKKQESKTHPLHFEPHSCEGSNAKQALKMMYVGFSRPTHLLCFAVLKENVKDDLEKFKNAGWKIDYDLAPINSNSQNVQE